MRYLVEREVGRFWFRVQLWNVTSWDWGWADSGIELDLWRIRVILDW